MKPTISMHRALHSVAAFVSLTLLWTCEARAIAPRYASDDELATYPVIVIAKWDKAPAESHHQYQMDKDLGQVVTTILPNEGIALDTIVDEDFLIAEPAERQLKLSYFANGNRQGVKAWIGTINVEFGDGWKYERVVKHIEEVWENGNLKATGTTVNGVKLGEWNYFNEQGDRIKIEYPGTGRGTAICNSGHPKNKGAGKRQTK